MEQTQLLEQSAAAAAAAAAYFNTANIGTMSMGAQIPSPNTSNFASSNQQHQIYHQTTTTTTTNQQPYLISPPAFPHNNELQHSYPLNFFYEMPQIQPTMTTSTGLLNANNTTLTVTPSLSTPMTMSNINTNTLNHHKMSLENRNKKLVSTSMIDEDYVQNLTNELQHTKQLLNQYQLRTEQLMELVKKQTDKIAELREQVAANNIKPVTVSTPQST
ncbi:MAG: hypothetical protein EXX96DRAFT_618154 [Benjaminiella poitrasii]|nr:MAG: hypothetical protein EXX96DRAFT_618154 [Benjaminiella poitrasii]